MARPVSITRAQYLRLVQFFREHPADYSKVAKLAGVKYNIARRAWLEGWPSIEWAHPIAEVVGDETRLAEVLAEKVLRVVFDEEQETPKPAKKDQPLTKRQRRQKGILDKAKREKEEAATSARVETEGLTNKIASVILETDDAITAGLASAYATRVKASELASITIGQMAQSTLFASFKPLAEVSQGLMLETAQAVEGIRQRLQADSEEGRGLGADVAAAEIGLATLEKVVTLGERMVNMTGNLMKLWRLHNDKPTGIVEHRARDVSAEEVQEKARAMLRGLKMIEAQPFSGYWNNGEHADTAATPPPARSHTTTVIDVEASPAEPPPAEPGPPTDAADAVHRAAEAAGLSVESDG